MIVKLLNEHHLEFLSLKGDCRGLSKFSLVKMPHCWKSHALAQFPCALVTCAGKSSLILTGLTFDIRFFSIGDNLLILRMFFHDSHLNASLVLKIENLIFKL